MINTNGTFPQTFTCPYCGTTSNASVCPRRSCLDAAYRDRTTTQGSLAMITVRKVTMGWMVESTNETGSVTHAIHIIRRNGKFFAYTHDFRDRRELLLEGVSFLACARLVRSPRSAVA